MNDDNASDQKIYMKYAGENHIGDDTVAYPVFGTRTSPTTSFYEAIDIARARKILGLNGDVDGLVFKPDNIGAADGYNYLKIYVGTKTSTTTDLCFDLTKPGDNKHYTGTLTMNLSYYAHV